MYIRNQLEGIDQNLKNISPKLNEARERNYLEESAYLYNFSRCFQQIQVVCRLGKAVYVSLQLFIYMLSLQARFKTVFCVIGWQKNFYERHLCYQMCSISMLQLHNTLDLQSTLNCNIAFDYLNHMGGQVSLTHHFIIENIQKILSHLLKITHVLGDGTRILT